MDRVLCGMRWSRCLVYLDDVISFGADAPEALTRLTEVLERLSSFGLQLEAKKCTFMQTEVAFLGHIVGRVGLVIQNFTELSEPLVALTRKGSVLVWKSERQEAFERLKSCLLQAPILGFSTEVDRFVLDTDASLFAVGGVLNQIPGRPGGGDRICQSESPAVSTSILYYTMRDVGCCYDVF